VEPVTPWQEQCTRVVSRCTHTLTHVGTVFVGTGRGMGKFTQGLPVSPPNKGLIFFEECDIGQGVIKGPIAYLCNCA
jgi:hypothetical protein